MGNLIHLDETGRSYRDTTALKLQYAAEALQAAAAILARQKGIGSELFATKLVNKANELNTKKNAIKELK